MKITKKNSVEISPVVFDIIKHSFTATYDHIPDKLEVVEDYIDE